MPAGWIAGATVLSGVVGAMASGSAADTQAQSAANAQQISQNEFNTITQQNAPYMQSGYGALSALDYGLGISPQTATGGNPNAPGAIPQNAGAANGYDPSSGYQIGAGGSISQMIPGGTGAPPAYTGNHASPYGSIGQNGMSLGQTVGQPAATGQLGGSGVPIAPGSTTGGQPGQTGGLGYGSLTAPFTTANWQQLSPAYNFQKQQGMQGVQNADAAGAGAMSGAALKDLTDYNQSAANQSFNNAFTQYQTQQGNIFSRLSGIAQLGQASANNTGQQGTALAGQAGNAAMAAGSYQAAGTVGSANAISGGLSSAAPWLAYGGAPSPQVDTNWIGSQANNTINNTDWSDPSIYCDRRLKVDIERLGALDNGVPIYKFKYMNSQTVHVGVMADELERVYPDAVSVDANGFKMVDYGRVR